MPAINRALFMGHSGAACLRAPDQTGNGLTSAKAVASGAAERIEHAVRIVALVECAALLGAAKADGGIALLHGRAAAGTRAVKTRVGIGVAGAAAAGGVAFVVDGEGVRHGRGQNDQSKGGGELKLHGGLECVCRILQSGQDNMAVWRQRSNVPWVARFLLRYSGAVCCAFSRRRPVTLP